MQHSGEMMQINGIHFAGWTIVIKGYTYFNIYIVNHHETILINHIFLLRSLKTHQFINHLQWDLELAQVSATLCYMVIYVVILNVFYFDRTSIYVSVDNNNSSKDLSSI